MTDKTKMNKIQKEFVDFAEKYNNKEYNHIYWFFWEEEGDEYFDEIFEEMIEEFCKEYNYDSKEFENGIYENFITK